MLFKGLLTAAVVAIVYFMGHYRMIRSKKALHSNPPPVIVSQRDSRHDQTLSGPVRAALYGMAVAVSVVTGWFLYETWREARQIVQIRVINVQTGGVTLYKAEKRSVHHRAFKTLDGRQVTLADIERMEFSEGSP